MDRPDFSGGSQATAKIWTICSGVNLPGGRAGAGREELLDGPAQGGVAFEAFDANEPVQGVQASIAAKADLPPRQSDLGGDLGLP